MNIIYLYTIYYVDHSGMKLDFIVEFCGEKCFADVKCG
jgi:hypothetical protein